MEELTRQGAVAAEYVITIYKPGDLDMIVGVRQDGSVEYGEGFTAEPAAREFWTAVGNAYPEMFIKKDLTNKPDSSNL